MKRLLTLFWTTSILMVAVFGCAPGSASDPEPFNDIEVSTEYYIEDEDVEPVENDDTDDITSSYFDIEEKFLTSIKNRFEMPYCLYDSAELTAEILETRQGNLVIERCVGTVIDKQTGDGKILNCNDSWDYISYSGVDNINDGSIVLSYMIYNPDNNYIDDIIERYDFVISNEGG